MLRWRHVWKLSTEYKKFEPGVKNSRKFFRRDQKVTWPDESSAVDEHVRWKHQPFYTSFGGLLLAGRPWISHERRKQHTRECEEIRNETPTREERRRVQTDTPCAKYFRSWKAEAGENKKKSHYPWKHATQGDEGLCFASDRFLSRAAKARSLNRRRSVAFVIETQGLFSTRNPTRR